MPSAVRQVGFAPIPATYSRLPGDDELYVMKSFSRHASHCVACAHPYETHLKGKTLCSKGHQRAQDVAQYVFNKAGKAFSVVDLESDKRIQVEIPVDCDVVRELLKAMERGLRLRRKQAPVSYDKNYYIPPRTSQPEHHLPNEPRHLRKPKLETPLRRVSAHSENPSYTGRGSLYGHDMRERERRYRQSTFYSIGSRGVLPVPAKEDWY